jgi:hypothetical protein
VLSPAAVAARRAALTAFAALAAEPALLRAEAFRRNKAVRASLISFFWFREPGSDDPALLLLP